MFPLQDGIASDIPSECNESSVSDNVSVPTAGL